MYPSSSSSSSSHKSIQTTTGGAAAAAGAGLVRYGSAPSSFLSTAADSVIGASGNMSSSPSTRDFVAAGSPMFPPPPRPLHHSRLHPHPHHHHPLQPAPLFGNYFSGDSQPTSKVNAPASAKEGPTSGGGGGLHRAFGLTETGLGASASSSAASASASASLPRQSSSPAGFLYHLASDNGDFSLTCGAGTSKGGAQGSRLKAQLSFTRQDSLSQVSENAVKGGSSSDNGHHHTNQSSYTNFGLDSWESSSNIVFSPPGKCAKTIDGDIYSFDTLETQFSLPQTTLEMATVERMLHIPDDSVPCKIRAKRGCATHPRSIAERERRTRISGRLKKLQELVPNMDKQTSYADMLDLAVEHIKTLQNHVQRLRRDLNNCTCGCKLS
ncbi:hypothetical protein MLD38_038440 [Melastoma candidum]|uniref:Uncharacterized protein n=1 Tax=Melastoma candidum TaxID=119954 RepID=A0ACB9L031_9MYRT|nr:hypothetical protein MLD38_038440 [Melastoma candidum]